MKSILAMIAICGCVLGIPQVSVHRHLLGPIQPTQLPPIRGDEAAEVEDQSGHEARTYQTGYRLQNTGYRPLPDTTDYRSQEYNQYRGQTNDYNQFNRQNIDYRLNTPKEVVPILTYSNELTFDGSYNYNFESADGISRQETGVMTNPGTEDESPSVRGSYSYTAPDGQLITVNYIADKDGFRAEGAHLPTPPPVPDAIAKSLEYIARVRAAQPAGYEDDGQYQQESQRPYRPQAVYSN